MSPDYERLTSVQVSKLLDLWSQHIRGKVPFRLVKGYLRSLGCSVMRRGDVAGLLIRYANRHRRRSTDS